MQLDVRSDGISDHEVSICGPTHEGGWCKYCQAVKQIDQAAAEERESCAKLAEFMIDMEDSATDEWKEGFYTACTVLSMAIRARGMEPSVSLLKQLRDSSLSRGEARSAQWVA